MTAATAKETVTPFPKAKKAIAAAVADPAPPPDLMVPAIEPLSEYRADAHRRRLDAQGEIDLIDARERNAEASYRARLEAASANCEAEIQAAIAKRDRLGEFERQRREAEHHEAMRQREQQERIVAGAEAALIATDGETD